MVLSHLYSAIMRGKWFIDLRDVESSHKIMQQVIEGQADKLAEEMLSDRKPLQIQLAAEREMRSGQNFSDAPEDSVAIVPVHGTMLKYGTYCAYGTSEIADLIYEAANNPKVSGIMLDMDSGGGSVDAIAPLAEALEYNRSKGKSSVAWCDLCASANYYAAIYCDEIVASNLISSEFGSIGVMMSFPDYAKYYAKEGIEVHTIYSDLSDYKNAPFEAAKRGEYELIKNEELNPLARKFQADVKTRRGDKLVLGTEGILQGRMFYAEEAQKIGLIDGIGNKNYAINRVREIRRDAGINEYIKSKS